MGRSVIIAAAAFAAVVSAEANAQERVVCTLAQESGTAAPLIREGDCDARISPASTFKVAISLMGFDSGILVSPEEPALPFREGHHVDWNPTWRRTTTPESWMRDSVVWFSQEVTRRIGAERFGAYVAAFGYGDEDVSGDAGAENGLTHAWLSSSLQISPDEQVAFLSRMLAGDLPVSASAVEQTRSLMAASDQPGDWRVYGKTGAGLPLGADGALLKGQPFGWYVGWAEKGDRSVVFARLIRFSERPSEGTPGAISRTGLIAALFGEDGALN